MKNGKTAWILLLLVILLPLSGCRVRTGISPLNPESVRENAASSADSSGSGALLSNAPDPEDSSVETENSGDSENRTKENPEASRKEYDENAPAEIVSGTDRELHGEGEGEGAPFPEEESPDRVHQVSEQAENAAVRTVAAGQAEKKGVAEDAEKAESALTYFTVLLQDRTASLFECQRLNVYWETKENHVTVFRTSPEHSLILNAGTYDVSSRLLAENLHVDEGWICRKNPGVIVKIVDRTVLGSAVFSSAAAKSILENLLARDGWAQIDAVRNRKVLLLSEEMLESPHLQVAAMLLIAKTAYPELYADTDPDRAVQMLQEEAAGSIPAGLNYYSEGLFR